MISFQGFAQQDHAMPMNEEKKPDEKKSPAAEDYEKRKPGSVHIGKTVEYDLYINDTMVNFTGKHRHAMAVNGQIPAPTVTFTEGDTAVIRVHNLMKMETSIHWHGILFPNKEDGVSYLTTVPIKPGTTHTFSFPLIQSGTFWYHSHTMLQEQSGLYGSIVIHPAKKEYDLKEYVIVLSDWTDENPHQVLRYLKRAGEWYAIKKGALQSYGEAIASGYFKDKLKQEWSRMPAMDVSDVYYNKFLMNGSEKTYFKDVKPGEVVRLRIINGSASSYFNLQYAGGDMQVISADGINIKPFSIDKIEIATAETYDILITVPEDGSAELRATSSDVTGYSSGFFGDGMLMKAPDIPKLNYFQMMRDMNEMSDMSGMDMNGTGKKKDKMDMGGKMDQPKTDNPKMPSDTTPQKKDQPMNMQSDNNVGMAEMDMKNMPGMDMGMDMGFSYDKLRALHPTTLDTTRKWREVHLKLTGNMLRYVWSFDNKTLSAADLILIQKGENVRFILENTTMMRHPLHLHGHFFRFVNAQGEYSPMKHTFDIKAMETVTIEFEADEQQDWFFHCHILYHMMAGMARIVSYEGSEQNEFARTGYKKLKREDNKLYPWFDLSLHSQGAWLEGNISNNKNALEFEGRVDWKGDYETETHLLRYLDKKQFFAVYLGFDKRNNKTLPLADISDSKDNRQVIDAGFYYLLPMLVRSEWRITQTGKVRLQLERRDIPLSNNFFFDIRANTDKEYTVGFRYMVSKYLSLSTNYDSDYKWGAGLTWHY
jgi:CopA family copper-resistance protein